MAFRVGEAFVGSGYSFLPTRSARLDVVTGAGSAPLPARAGDSPAVTVGGLPEGLVAIVHETTESDLTWTDKPDRTGWERFVTFAEHKDAAEAVAAHEAAGLPREGVTEGYVRYAKALLGVGEAAGADRATGLRTEIVALANPYTDDLSGGLPVRVLLDGAPRAGAQVELFAQAPDGTVTVTTHPADGEGVAVLPVAAGHVYLADSVAFEEGPGFGGSEGPMWRTLWAALTFAVPAD